MPPSQILCWYNASTISSKKWTIPSMDIYLSVFVKCDTVSHSEHHFIWQYRRVFSLPAIPLLLTIPNGFASLETVYIKRSPTSGYRPLYEFQVFFAWICPDAYHPSATDQLAWPRQSVHHQPLALRRRHEVGSLLGAWGCHRLANPRDVQGLPKHYLLLHKLSLGVVLPLTCRFFVIRMYLCTKLFQNKLWIKNTYWRRRPDLQLWVQHEGQVAIQEEEELLNGEVQQGGRGARTGRQGFS